MRLRFVIPAFVILFGAILDDLNGGDVLESVRPLVFGFVAGGVVGLISGTIMVRDVRDIPVMWAWTDASAKSTSRWHWIFTSLSFSCGVGPLRHLTSHSSR